jgi:hypothetical protein
MNEYLQAWQWITSRWNCPSWIGIPDDKKKTIGLDPRVGMCHGSLVTQGAAKGMNEFINRMNAPRN